MIKFLAALLKVHSLHLGCRKETCMMSKRPRTVEKRPIYEDRRPIYEEKRRIYVEKR